MDYMSHPLDLKQLVLTLASDFRWNTVRFLLHLGYIALFMS